MKQTRSRGDEQVVRKAYAKLAFDYDARFRSYVERSIEETTARLDIEQGERLLDIGCGTGTLFQRLGTSSKWALVGVDISLDMLAVASGKKIACASFAQGSAYALPFRAGSFDIVVSCSAFHYWRHPRRALDEMARVLKSSGRLVITDWCHDYLTCRLCDLYLKITDPAHQRMYRSEECIRLLSQAGFKPLELDRYKISWLWGLMTARARQTSPARNQRR